MRKYKSNPKKPGQYLAWFDGKLNQFYMTKNNEDYHNERNHLYFDGKDWFSLDGNHPYFMVGEYVSKDRWSYIPKVS